MSTTTTNYSLIKPELTDVADITATNQNWDTIDAELKDLYDGKLSLSGGIMNGILWTGNGTNNGYGFINSDKSTAQLGICNEAGDGTANRNLNINNGKSFDLNQAVTLIDKLVDEKSKSYNIFGEHNIDLLRQQLSEVATAAVG